MTRGETKDEGSCDDGFMKLEVMDKTGQIKIFRKAEYEEK